VEEALEQLVKLLQVDRLTTPQAEVVEVLAE
jgi:hypothetical protein